MKTIKFVFLYLSRLISRYSRRIPSKRKPSKPPVFPTTSFIKATNSKPSSSGRSINFFLPSSRTLLFSIFLIAAFLCLWFFGFKANAKTLLSEGIVGLYTKNNVPPIVANLLSQSLVTLDKNGNPQPNLVSGWQVNNDGTVYTFKLRNNLYWNDGVRLKASQIKFILQDVDVSYPDDQTIQFKLADSFAPFPTLLTAPVFEDNSLIGVGNYRVARIETNHDILTKIVLNPASSTSKSLPNLSIRFYPDEKTARVAFELGEVDSLVGLNESGELKDQPSTAFKRINTFNKLAAIFYNTKDAILSDKNFRRALSLASPNIEGEERAKTPIPPNSWAYNDQVRDLSNDQKEAKSYLSKVNAGKDSTITLTTTPILASLGENIIQSWKQAGISGVLRVESGVPQNFQALLIAQPIPPDPDQYTLWHSTQTGTNFSKYSSARIDKDLEDGRKTLDKEKRLEKYQDFQKVILDDSPATFLYFPKTDVVYRTRIGEALDQVLGLQIPQI